MLGFGNFGQKVEMIKLQQRKKEEEDDIVCLGLFTKDHGLQI